MAVEQQNPLLSTQKSDSGLHVALHPLVLLTISDYITRHTLRQQKGAIVGALMGQQNGREITVEHAFECKVIQEKGDVPALDEAWFTDRLQQMKDVHKSPALDLVGWYTIVPTSGPQDHHVALQAQLSNLYSEATILLGFHPEAALEGSVGGKLPLTIYEANFETSENARREDVDMEDAEYPFPGLFKELPYSVETGEAEMIGIDFVARGGGNATAVETATKAPTSKKDTSTLKGKSREENEEHQPVDMNVLSREEEELIASLTAKANAIKMLHSRINLITTYLEKLPPHEVGNVTESPPETGREYATIDHSILRSIQALLNRLALLVPADNAAFSQDLLAEQNDVNLVSLLSTVTESIKYAREMGRKFAIVDQARTDKSRSRGANSDAWKTGDAFNPEKMLGRNIGGVGDLMM